MTPTPTPELANATSGFASSFGNAWGLGGVFAIVLYVIGALLAAQFVAPWLARSQLLTGAGRRLAQSLSYAIKGLAASAVLIAAALPVYFVATVEGDTQGLALTAIGVVVAAYVGLVVVGWLADRAVSAFLAAHPEYDEWGDLFPDTEDTTEEEPV